MGPVKNGEIHLMINTPIGRESHLDEKPIRTEVVAHGAPCATTITGAAATETGFLPLALDRSLQMG